MSRAMCARGGCCAASSPRCFWRPASAGPYASCARPERRTRVAARDAARRRSSVAPLRPRRGRNLFDRLRQAGRPNEASARSARRTRGKDTETGVYDVLDDVSVASDDLLDDAAPGAVGGRRSPVFAGADQVRPWRGAGHPRRSPQPGRRRPASWTPPRRMAADSSSVRSTSSTPASIPGALPASHARWARPASASGPTEDFGTLVVDRRRVGALLVSLRGRCRGPRRRGTGARAGDRAVELAREERDANAVADDLGVLSLIAA